MSFKDTFTRGESSEQQLQYDDTAFNYFFLAICISIAVPLSFSILKSIFINPFKSILQKSCKCKACYQNAQIIYEKKSIISKGFFCKILFIVFICYIISKLYQQIQQAPLPLKSFDPFEILEIDPGTPEQEIKKSYRRLSKIWHPDKNPSPDAQSKFILLTKAYETLTDEKKRQTYEKYGNPDGPGTFQVAIAMPSFLLKKENHIAVLAVFFLVLLVIIPSLVIYWYQEGNKYDDLGNMNDNQVQFYSRLNENLTLKQCSELLAFSLEFQMPNRGQEMDLNKLRSKIEDVFLPLKQVKLPVQFCKAYVMICAHLLGEKIPSSLDQDYRYIVEKSPNLIQGMINLIMGQMAFHRKVPPQYNPYRQKFMGSQCLLTLIEFQQNMTQGLWIKDQPTAQLCNYQEKKSQKKKMDFREFLHNNKDSEEISLRNEISMFPQVDISYKVEVEGEEVMTNQDQISLKVTIKNENFKKQGQYAHLPKYFGQKYHKWHIVVSNDKKEILYYQLLSSNKPEVTTLFKFQQPPGSVEWELDVRSDCYKGLDFQDTIKFSVLDGEKVKRKIEFHPDDVALDREPTIFNQMMQQFVSKEDSEEEDEDEPQEKQSPKKKDAGMEMEEEEDDQNENQDKQKED